MKARNLQVMKSSVYFIPKMQTWYLTSPGGAGEPGLTIATMQKEGKVVITDLSENMLAIAEESAAKRGIKNIEFRVCDACDLPFADNTFDAVSCRLGFMFFPNMMVAAKEMYRVRKPGGSFGTSVWNGPGKNCGQRPLAVLP